MLALSDAYDTVLSKNVAHLLGIKRPTVHHALEVLQEKSLIRKELYGDVRLTEEGRALAKSWKHSATSFPCCSSGASPSRPRRA